jgi:hypothetical protein
MTDDLRESDDRPWERPGALRRDCECHRADLLRTLSVTALLCAALAACLAVPAVTGMVLHAAVVRMGRRDQAMMGAGLMDPAGMSEARDAQAMAGVAAVLCLGTAVTWVVAILTKVPI